jgi:protein transport protein SEC23
VQKHTLFEIRSTKTAEIATLLGLRPGIAQREKKDSTRFLMPVSECEFQLTSILEDLSRDCWPAKSSQRQARCTGSALNVAVGLLEAAYKDHAARIMMFVGGPPTAGPGMVVSVDAKETIRSHHDLQKGDAPHYKKAMTFFETLADRAVTNGHVIDIFACSLDQVGLAEMRVCVEKTGGLLVLDDSFTRGVFQGSFKRVFQRATEGKEKSNDLLMAFGAECQVLTSRELKVCGAIGGVTGLDRKHSCISEFEVGVGGTCAWRLGGADPNTTVALMLDVVNQTEGAPSPQGYVQIVTRYKHSNGTTLLRVTTVAKTFADTKNEQGFNYIKAGFDQEAAAVLLARYAVWRTKTEHTIDILRWLDRTLIRLVQKFATFKKDDPNTFRLAPEFSYFPQFMFHLRRSQFLQVFNSSPDETAFYRLVLLRENTNNALVMLQPTLIAYSLEGAAQPVMLDVSSCAPNRILLLDTFFHVVIWYGAQIAQWKSEKVHLNPEYEYFAQLLKAPKTDAARAMDGRFPTPRFIECVDGGSQERFLKAKLNPSITQSTVGLGEGEPPVFTEDVSLKVFMQHLRRLAVQG